ncbi:MAG: hypothetical protein M3279_13280 [Actinomycetota bacterium]|nr:hypothetical protein [Actinomycetota bacterium]
MRSERVRLRNAVAAAFVFVLGAGCDGGDGSALPEGCGLPTREPRAQPELIPEALLLGGDAEVSAAGRRKGGVTGVLTITKSVQDGLPLYRKAVRAAGFEIVGEDNEGFEAEIFVRKGKQLGQIQIRTSVCDDASVVFVNIVKGDFAMPIITSPSPSAP